MKTELKRVSKTKEEIITIEVTVVGTIEYQQGRQYPWLGQHGSVCQYFGTKSEAVEFARTGGK